MKTHILIVDDETDALDLMQEFFKSNGYETTTAHNGLEALKAIAANEPDIILSDIFMPEMDGMELLAQVTKSYPEISMVMITAHGTIETAVTAMQNGAKDYILKPLQLDEIVSKVRTISQLKSLMRENKYLRNKLEDKFGFDKIIGKNVKIYKIFDLIKDVATVNSTVIIRGEHGTGKELIANAIHFNSDRVKQPFVTVNCAVLTETLLESELFGHEAGSFTDAKKRKIGLFEFADGGTVFLDEIGDISQNMQIKLLRVLQEKEFNRVGGTEIIKVDIRVIAATNKNLEKAMEVGDFRQDLYYRLNVIPIEVPPLRERADDIPILISHFVDKFNNEFNKSITGVDQESMQKLLAFDWPGNVRQLEHTIERAILLSKSDLLTAIDFPEQIINSDAISNIPIVTNRPLTDLVGEYEKQIILKALRENKNNKLRTAEKLGIHRSTFMSKLSKYEIP